MTKVIHVLNIKNKIRSLSYTHGFCQSFSPVTWLIKELLDYF